MLRTVALSLAIGLLVNAQLSWADKNPDTPEQWISQWAKNKLLTADQAKELKSSTSFLTLTCTSEKFSSCRPAIDFDIDCAVTDSVADENIKGVTAGKSRSFLIDDLSSLGIRVAQYPNILKAFGKWDAAAEQRLAALKLAYDAGVIIANKKISPVARLRESKPILEKAEQISKDMAKSAGFLYEGGCGAGPEDSQKVDFVFSEKPKSAFYILQMDFDACKRILGDPYDLSKCDAWERIREKNSELAGNYRYRVIWSDGTITEHSFKALSTGKKAIEIVK